MGGLFNHNAFAGASICQYITIRVNDPAVTAFLAFAFLFYKAY
jgi:hypothetical protein